MLSTVSMQLCNASAALTEEFQPGLLCLRNTLSGMVSHKLYARRTDVFHYSSIVTGLFDVKGKFIFLRVTL